MICLEKDLSCSYKPVMLSYSSGGFRGGGSLPLKDPRSATILFVCELYRKYVKR